MEAELLQQFEAVNDAATATTTADLGPPSSIANTPSRLKQTSPICPASPASFFLADVSMIIGQRGHRTAATWCRSSDRSRSAALLTLLRHHVGQVRQREALADAALAVDRDDLRLPRRGLAGPDGMPPHRGMSTSYGPPVRIIFRQRGRRTRCGRRIGLRRRHAVGNQPRGATAALLDHQLAALRSAGRNSAATRSRASAHEGGRESKRQPASA